jgi:predicted metal-dependent hydrolase
LPSFIIISKDLKDILVGISLFNNADFFAAHDFFEEMWVESNREDRLFFQGLTQISVGCFHLICKNYKGAFSQFTKGTDKLNDFLPSYKNVDIEDLIKNTEVLINDLKDFSSNQVLEIDLKKIPRIKLKQ